MYLLEALQNTLIELNRAREKSGRSLNHYNYIRSRVSNSIELYFNQEQSVRILTSFDGLPHSASQKPETVDSNQLALLLQHLTDDFTSVLMMVEKKAGGVRELFVSDNDFAYDIISKHATGWMDSCADCGKSLHLKYDLLAQNVILAHKRLRNANDIVCQHRVPKPLELNLLCPSKKLVVSDSLNDFLIGNSDALTKHYDEFLNTELKAISSTSVNGKLLLSQFYARHNLGYFFVGKGALYLEQQPHVLLTKRHTAQQSPMLRARSMFVSMMDYAEFSGFCNQLGLDTYEVLKEQNAALIDVEESSLSITYTVNDHETGMPTISIQPATQEESEIPDDIPARA